MTQAYGIPMAQADGNARKIAKLVDYLWANPDMVLTIEQMTQIAGMSRRALFDSFRKRTGHSPQKYFKLVRLHFVHRELSDGASNITRPALKYNFYHLGDFSALYRRVYGVLPSATAKKGGAKRYSLPVRPSGENSTSAHY